MVGREEDKRFLLALRLLVLKEPDAEWVVDPVRDRDMLTLPDVYLPQARRPPHCPGRAYLSSCLGRVVSSIH